MKPRSSSSLRLRPCIGISTGYDPGRGHLFVNLPYLDALEKTGAVPLIFPALKSEAACAEFLDEVDGLVLVGGQDIAPSFFGALPQKGLGQVVYERDTTDLTLAREALQRQLPVLGICRGMQVINVAAGGSILQDLFTSMVDPLEHRQNSSGTSPWHSVEISASSRLAAIVGGSTLHVNSLHHQAVLKTAPGFRVSSTAPDGVIEAIEAEGPDWFALGVQWHPELLAAAFPEHFALFAALAEAARHRNAKLALPPFDRHETREPEIARSF